LFSTYGNFDPESTFWSQIVPTNYLDDITGDFQVHHAADDNVVRVDYSRNIVNILRQKGISSELFEYQSGGHNITDDSFEKAMDRSAEFLVDY
jgi:predicted esterase